MTAAPRFVAACVQMRTGRDPSRNRDDAVAMAREAADGGAHFVQTPEMTGLLERDRASFRDKITTQEDDPVLAALRDVRAIEERFRTGAGFGWHEHDHNLFEGTERFFRPGYVANLVPTWLPALDGVVAKLERGAQVVDVGCGHGASTILMAQAYPASVFLGVDYHEASITVALAGCGVPDYRRASTRITTRLPTPEEADLLQQSRARPVLVGEAVNIDAAGQPIDYTIARYAGGRVQIVVEGG